MGVYTPTVPRVSTLVPFIETVFGVRKSPYSPGVCMIVHSVSTVTVTTLCSVKFQSYAQTDIMSL